MAKKYFGLLKRDKKCPSCKGPFYNPRNQTTSLCETCESKMCAVCGKIRIHGARVSNDGFVFCNKHWSSFIRFKSEIGLNNHYSTDRDFKVWLDNRGKHISDRLGLNLIPNLEDDMNAAITGPRPNPLEPTPEAEARATAIDKIAALIEKGIIPEDTD